MTVTLPPTPPPATRNDNIRRFLAGIAPALVAAVAVLCQLLASVVPREHLWLLASAVAALVCLSAADWVWCAVRDLRERLVAKEHREVARAQALMRLVDTIGDALRDHDRETQAHLEQHDRCLQGLHQKLDHHKELHAAAAEEIAHLRRLVLDTEHAPVHRLGPRSLS